MPFGRASVSIKRVGSQRAALNQLAGLAARGSLDPLVRRTALALVADCPARDDICELEVIYNAVKHGDARIEGLKNGVRYVSDPRLADYFTSPGRLLEMCENGSCGGDCDDASCLVAALAGSLGFQVGLRAYGEPGSRDYSHVYAVAALPKIPRTGKFEAIAGMDTTVPRAKLGWQPPLEGARILTAWIEK